MGGHGHERCESEAVSQFHDLLGYYPGLYYAPDYDPANLYFWNVEASAVVPAKGNYSTKIVNTADITGSGYAFGFSASTTTAVVKPPPKRGHRADVNASETVLRSE